MLESSGTNWDKIMTIMVIDDNDHGDDDDG